MTIPASSKKPLIALTPNHNLEKDEPYMRPAYIKALLAVDAIPVILPLGLSESDLPQLADSFDAFLFTGGPDVQPSHYGEDTHARCGNVSVMRDQLEMALLKLAMDARKPILGICRGIQLINVTLGGSLYQDIPSQFPSGFPIAHTQPYDYVIPSHTVTVDADTLLADICRGTAAPDASHGAPSCCLKVNSMHHQAVRRLAPGLTASAHAADGLIEAIEKPDYPNFFVGVQWHPEYLWPDDDAAAGLFRRFADAARARNRT